MLTYSHSGPWFNSGTACSNVTFPTCPVQDHNHLWVVQTVQGDLFRELFARRSVESFVAQLEARRRKADSPPLLHDLSVGETGPASKKPRISLDEGVLLVRVVYLCSGGWSH